MNTKLVIVGRHPAKYSIEKYYDDVEQVNPTFKDEHGVMGFLRDYERKVEGDTFTSVLFQATPPQVTLALVLMDDIPVHVGLVFSKPGDRPPSTSRVLDLEGVELRNALVQLLNFINPRASVSVDESSITVTVESPMRFEFERIEWVN